MMGSPDHRVSRGEYDALVAQYNAILARLEKAVNYIEDAYREAWRDHEYMPTTTTREDETRAWQQSHARSRLKEVTP